MESYRHNFLCISSNVSFIPSLVLITPFVPHKTFLLYYLDIKNTYVVPSVYQALF